MAEFLKFWEALRSVAAAACAFPNAVQSARKVRRRRLRHVQLASGSPLFDREWYLSTYPDVARAGVDPLKHYLETGWREGRDPGPEFGSAAYLKANADVARSGVNPLIHYLEFGRDDGRGTFDRPPQADDLSDVSFGFEAPAPCRSYPVPDDPPTPWGRSHELDGGRADVLAAGEWVIGRAPEGAVRTRIEAHLELLAMLSGYPAAAGIEPDLSSLALDHLVDAWYVNETQLRTRWAHQAYPVVVRALQHAPLLDGAVSLVGEGLVVSALDTLDVELANPFFPVLFVFADANGEARGCSLLAFPSLCRGGLHYPELLDGDSVSAAEAGGRLGAKLVQILRQDVSPAVGTIMVRLDGADGSGPMFRSDLQCWLRKVMRVAVEPVGAVEPLAVGRYLAEAVAVRPSPIREGTSGRIVVDADSIVTIEALVEHRAQVDSAVAGTVSLLVCSPESSHPITKIDLPAGLDAHNIDHGLGRHARWPSTENARIHAPLAIKLGRSENLRDAELFTPSTGEVFPSLERVPVTWVIRVAEWGIHDLALAVQALAEQHRGEGDELALVGKVDRRTAALAATAFGNRLHHHRDLTTSLEAVRTPISVRVGGGILLHDGRSADVFSALLSRGAVSTVSLPLISTATRAGANGSVVSLGDIGTGQAEELDGATLQRLARCLWRTCYPVATPSQLLFAARSPQMRAWSEGTQEAEPLHLCSTHITATQLGVEARATHALAVPEADQRSITRVSEFFG